ncbi:MAG: hypothetical protein IH907_01545 [Proteobacteria bacterium]|nr:hypothetical protein [Pseudomonadota bacterium]
MLQCSAQATPNSLAISRRQWQRTIRGVLAGSSVSCRGPAANRPGLIKIGENHKPKADDDGLARRADDLARQFCAR